MSPINAQCDSKWASPPLRQPGLAHMHEHLTEPWQGRDFLLLLPSYAGGRSSLALRISLTRLTRLTHTADTDPVRQWPSLLTQHTRQEQQNRVAEHLQQLHLLSFSLCLSLSLDYVRYFGPVKFSAAACTSPARETRDGDEPDQWS